MGQGRRGIPCQERSGQQLRQLRVFLRPERHDVLRKLYECWGVRVDVAAVLRQRGLGSVFKRRTGMVWGWRGLLLGIALPVGMDALPLWQLGLLDRKSTRLNSSHLGISYAVFCLKK